MEPINGNRFKNPKEKFLTWSSATAWATGERGGGGSGWLPALPPAGGGDRPSRNLTTCNRDVRLLHRSSTWSVPKLIISYSVHQHKMATVDHVFTNNFPWQWEPVNFVLYPDGTAGQSAKRLVSDYLKPISQCRLERACIWARGTIGRGTRGMGEWERGRGSVYSQPGSRVDVNSRHATKEGFSSK